MASSSRENGGRGGGWEIKSEPKSSTSNGQTREKLTLHVKKRQSVDSRARLESPPVELATPKKSKKAKKGSKSKAKSSSTPTRRQLKDESTGSEDATGETPDPEDSTSPNQVDEVALQQARQDFINNAILKEILNEKKRVQIVNFIIIKHFSTSDLEIIIMLQIQSKLNL